MISHLLIILDAIFLPWNKKTISTCDLSFSSSELPSETYSVDKLPYDKTPSNCTSSLFDESETSFLGGNSGWLHLNFHIFEGSTEISFTSFIWNVSGSELSPEHALVLAELDYALLLPDLQVAWLRSYEFEVFSFLIDECSYTRFLVCGGDKLI